ncbi:MAG TPA: hypothetical protein VGN01_11060 [Acidobacteriaceae bacterium]|jgi:hypothetical protein
MPAKVTIKATTRTAPRKAAHHPLYDLRRVYELQGRIEILEGALAGSPFCDVSALASLAEQEFSAGRLHNAAEILRACEHLTFAALAPYAAGCPTRVSAELRAAITSEFNHITRSAELHWSEANAHFETPLIGPIALIYAKSLAEAKRALLRGAYRPALELARAAEALAKTTPEPVETADTEAETHTAAHRLAS